MQAKPFGFFVAFLCRIPSMSELRNLTEDVTGAEESVWLREQYTLTGRLALNGTEVLAPGRSSCSRGSMFCRLFAQRFGSMSRHIGQNQVSGCASQEYSGRDSVHRRIADLVERGKKFSHTAEVLIS